MPIYIEHAKPLGDNNKDMILQYYIVKYIYKLSVAFKILEEGESPPPGWTKSIGHLRFDVEMEFTRKVRWAKDGHRTPDT